MLAAWVGLVFGSFAQAETAKLRWVSSSGRPVFA
jgi:hypothetical protein